MFSYLFLLTSAPDLLIFFAIIWTNARYKQLKCPAKRWTYYRYQIYESELWPGYLRKISSAVLIYFGQTKHFCSTYKNLNIFNYSSTCIAYSALFTEDADNGIDINDKKIQNYLQYKTFQENGPTNYLQGVQFIVSKNTKTSVLCPGFFGQDVPDTKYYISK